MTAVRLEDQQVKEQVVVDKSTTKVQEATLPSTPKKIAPAKKKVRWKSVDNFREVCRLKTLHQQSIFPFHH